MMKQNRIVVPRSFCKILLTNNLFSCISFDENVLCKEVIKIKSGLSKNNNWNNKSLNIQDMFVFTKYGSKYSKN